MKHGAAGDAVALRERAAAMAATLAHRGPDDAGAWSNATGRIGLAHRRLAIVDLSPLGRNPMLRGDGRLAITFNGEVYNFVELRRELEALGHAFRSHTDTEVLLAAYDQWGLDCLERLVGMFAFAIWDEPRERLWIVRDRLGKKPLYYSEHGGCLSFASELKALLSIPGFPRRVDRAALQLYLRYGYVPTPFTIFESARKLPPAHYLLCEGGRTTVTAYWSPPVSGPSLSLTDDEAERRLDELLSTAVAERRIADVPLGAFLSGGVDSSLVVAMMAEQSGVPVRTHTVRFSDPAYNEADDAAAVARHLGTDHSETLCDEAEMLATIDLLPTMFDEPFADSSAIPTALVSRAARASVTVALSGDGGDELFFGYPRYRFFADARWVLRLPRAAQRAGAAVIKRAPRRLRRVADVLEATGGDDYSRFVAWTEQTAIAAMTGGPAPVAPQYSRMLERVGSRPRADGPGLLDLASYLPDDILVKVDRASMAVGLEVRAPLLDHRVVEFALQLPLDMKRRGTTTKWLLRRLLYKRVPRALVERPKMGLGVPLGTWFRGPLRSRMDQLCEGAALDALGLNPEPLRGLWREFKAGAAHRPDLVWQAFVLASWSQATL